MRIHMNLKMLPLSIIIKDTIPKVSTHSYINDCASVIAVIFGMTSNIINYVRSHMGTFIYLFV